METISLKDHFDYLIKSTENLHFSATTFSRYKARYNDVFYYCRVNGKQSFTHEDIDSFMEAETTGKKKYFVLESRKIAATVAKYFEQGVFEWQVITVPNYPLSQSYSSLLERFECELLKHLEPGTVRTSVGIVRQFFYAMEQSGVPEARLITDRHVLDFVRTTAPFHKSSMSKQIRTMRKLVCFFREESVVNLTADRFLTKAGRCRQKSLPCFTDEELQAIFAKINRSTDKGRRDYAVFLLALRTGLRASDISKLRLDDIDWKRNTISVVQKKTKVLIELPLTVDVGNAIADYILNSRCKTDNCYVFLSMRNDIQSAPIHPSTFNTCLRKYIKDAGMEKTGWDGKSFHAFRRTAGTRMIETNIPSTTVSQILGHTNVESTKRYIALDINTMKCCCLDLGDMVSRKEGLI